MSDLAYQHYWRRKQLLASIPHFKRCRWWPADGLAEAEQIIYRAIADAPDLLDVGAGDLRVKQKFERAGFRGTYDTQDISGEYAYTYRDLAEVSHPYHAILFLDVLEHLTLDDGMKALARLVELMAPGGVLVVQTPNALCCVNPLGTDMTHLHCYNLRDLWAHLSTYGLSVEGYRVVFSPERLGLWGSFKFLIRRIVVTGIIGSDYADNILLIARKGREQDPMSDADETYRLAEAAFERNDFVEFRRLVQEAAQVAPPNQAVLTLLDMAAEFEQRALSRRFVAWHPQSLDARLHEIHWVVRTASDKGQWQGLYAELLAEQRGNDVNESRVRLSRLQTSVEKHAFETLYEDVRWLWKWRFALTMPNAGFLHKIVLRRILRIDHPGALPAIHELRALLVEEPAAEMLEHKERELASFARWE